MKEQNVLLIGGNRKSGTSMLHSLFDDHPEVYVPPQDLSVLYAYYPEWTSEKYSDADRETRLRKVVLEDWEKSYRQYEMESSSQWLTFKEHFEQNISRVNLKVINEVINFLIEGLSKSAPSNSKWLVVKETSTEMYVPWLLKDRPNWNFLHLFRDPRDNHAALKSGQSHYYSHLGNDQLDTLSSTILRYQLGFKWNQWNTLFFNNERYHTVRFEDIVQNTSSIMNTIAKWLNIEMQETLTQPTKGGQPFSGNNHDGTKFHGISDKNLGRWRERIDNEEAQILEFVLEKEMEALNYKHEFEKEESAVAAGNWYAQMNFKYFFADRFANKA